MMHAKIHKDGMGVENLLPFDWLNINEYWAIHMNTHSNAHEYSLEHEFLPKFHNFGGEYQFAIEFACLAHFYLTKEAFNQHSTVWDRSYV